MSSFVPRKALGKFMHVTDVPIRLGGGKSLVYFLGAGFCPYCAAERWAIVEALARFGTWTGLLEDSSAARDEKFLNIPTLNLSRSEYQSEYIEFTARETSDRNFEPLQELAESDYEILDKYNPDQIIPFLLIDGQYVQVGSGYSPQLLEGMDHSKVKSQIKSGDTALGRSINEEADNITALACKSVGGKLAACSSKPVMDLLGKLSLNHR